MHGLRRMMLLSAFTLAWLIPALSCGGGGGGSSSGGSTPPAVSVAITSPLPTPPVTVNGTLTFTALVSHASNPAVTWSVLEGGGGGSITAGGVYTASATPGTYHVVATSVADPTKSASAAVTVVAAPAITSFTAAKGTLTAGTGTTLTAIFSGGTGSVNQSLGAVTSGTPKATGNLGVSTVFTLTVTNAAGDTTTAQVTVTVVAAPAISVFTASPTAIGSGSTSTLTGTFTGGTGAVNQGVGAVASGVGATTPTLAATTTFTLTVTNAAGDFVTATATVTVYTAVPTITAFTATPATITQGTSSSLGWTVANATSLAIDQGVGSVALAGTQSVSPTTTTTYTLTATNPMGNSTATATVTVVFAPQISSFTALPTTVIPGGSSVITPVFSQGTASIDQGIGPVSSSTGYSTGPLSLAKTYTLTVTNAAGTSVSRSLTVHVDPGTFQSAGSMVSARSFALAMPLPDGRVLVMGGTSGGTTTAEFYDPSANAGAGGFVAAAGSLSPGRSSFGWALLPTGKVLVVGGSISGTSSTQVDLFDPVAGTFTPSAHVLSVPRTAPWVALLQDGRVLIAGGFNTNGTSFQSLNSCEIYNSVTDTFSPTGDLGVAQSTGYATVMPAFTLPNGKVLVAGGGNSPGTADAELYDPGSGTWSPAPAALNSNWFAATTLADGRVFFAGDGHTGNTCILYDASTNLTASTGGLLNPSYSSPGVTLLGDGRVLYAGAAGAPGFEVAADGELYDPATGLWSYTGSFGNRGEQAMALLRDGRVLACGGFDYTATGVLGNALVFDAGPAVAAAAPGAAVVAPASTTAGTAGLTASVPATTGARYTWLIQGGTITAGTGTPTVTFTAGAAGTLTLHCLVISPYGIPARGTASVTVN